MKDLVLLVPDKNTQFALKGALSRPEAMEIRSIQFEFRVHPGRDGGVRRSGPDVLAVERKRFKHGLLMLDFEGSGTDLADGKALEGELDELDRRLAAQWTTAAKTIVIEPELDVWVWGSDNAIETAINWTGERRLREWLRDQGFAFQDNGKPVRPKEALEAALKVPPQPRSSALYQRIAETISLRHCEDEAFIRLRKKLTEWFPK